MMVDLERGVRPVVHRPGAQLGAIRGRDVQEAQAWAPAGSSRGSRFSARPIRAAANPRRGSAALPSAERPASPARQRRLDRRRAAEPMTRPCVGGSESRVRPAAPPRAAPRAAAASAAARAPRRSCPARLAAARACRAGSRASTCPCPPCPHVVPGFVREALHVVGQVAGEVDDGCRRGRAPA